MVQHSQLLWGILKLFLFVCLFFEVVSNWALLSAGYPLPMRAYRGPSEAVRPRPYPSDKSWQGSGMTAVHKITTKGNTWSFNTLVSEQIHTWTLGRCRLRSHESVHFPHYQLAPAAPVGQDEFGFCPDDRMVSRVCINLLQPQSSSPDRLQSPGTTFTQIVFSYSHRKLIWILRD